MDLSNYVRVGRYDLPEPTRTTASAGNLLGQEASGVAYNWDSGTLFLIGDGGRSITEVSKTGQLISTMTLGAGSSPQGTAFYDPEGITYIGGGQFVFTEERDRNAVLITYEAGATKDRDDAQVVNLGTFSPNIGLEGLTYDPLTGGFIFVKEASPIGVFQTTLDFANNIASNGSATTENAVNLFDPALLGLSDVADIFALSNLASEAGGADAANLLIISQEEGKIIEVDRAGNILSQLVIQTDPGNPLGVSDQQHEGITVDSNGFIYVVNENGGGDADHPQLWVYAPADFPNAAPSAIALGNALTIVEENTGTAQRFKVADILVTDDGIGVNALSLSGADAAIFEIDSTGLYLRAGTVLDFETKTSYAVTVAVDDANVGTSPDATADYLLTVSDIANESSAPTLFISEVAPWSSGNSPIGFDWFEVTNNGAAAVDITGWKVDDDSAAFSNARALNGITSIGARESVIFFETSNLEAAKTAFINSWFGGVAPVGVQFGSYTGSGIGLSTGGDQVNLFNAAGEVQASVSFGASPTASPFATFNNAGAINNGAITTMSESGTNGAFAITTTLATVEIGSPGTVGKLFVSEVAPWASGDSPVGADWFEVTNSTGLAIDVAGWKVDDNSQSPVAAVALNGIGSIGAGESVIFINGDASDVAAFVNTWFGGTLPTGLQIGTYDGSGIGLSTGGDQVNLYDASNMLRANISFGSASTPPALATFDNSQGINNAGVTMLSSPGINGAFQVATVLGTTETGSPGTIVTIINDDNAAPTAIALDNVVVAIDENSSTLARIKVADVAVADDGLGTNAFGLTGADAAFFEVDATGLYLKAGTALDFESKASYAVSVTVDDPTVGTTPDASVDYLLAVNNIVNEGTGPAIRITEVAPWSSGDSPVGVDWFEITNFSDDAVTISGWRVDDDSSNFGSSVALNGVTTVAAGESIIFLQTNNLASTSAAFLANWFDGTMPAGVRFGSYTGSGIGLSGGGDAVILFDAAGTVMANVTFGAATPTPTLATFDNAEGLNNVLLSNLAAQNVDGAFTIANVQGNSETGSPGGIAVSVVRGDDGDNSLSGDVRNNILSGGLGNDLMRGGAGEDVLNGGQGADTMFGDAGIDTASYADAASGVTANFLIGINAGEAAGDKYRSIENLVGSRFDDMLTGDKGVNIIDGGAGDDVLNGGEGRDTLIGGAGNDRLVGGRGADMLTGNAGSDMFVFAALDHLSAGKTKTDMITDFVAGEDMIDLSGIDAILGGGDDAFTFIGNGRYSGTAGELRYFVDGGDIYVAGDVGGDGITDFLINVGNVGSLSAENFLL